MAEGMAEEMADTATERISAPCTSIGVERIWLLAGVRSRNGLENYCVLGFSKAMLINIYQAD